MALCEARAGKGTETNCTFKMKAGIIFIDEFLKREDCFLFLRERMEKIQKVSFNRHFLYINKSDGHKKPTILFFLFYK